MQDYKSLRLAIMTRATLVDTHVRARVLLYSAIGAKSRKRKLYCAQMHSKMLQTEIQRLPMKAPAA